MPPFKKATAILFLAISSYFLGSLEARTESHLYLSMLILSLTAVGIFLNVLLRDVWKSET
jgi:hypothetical protein